jgi:lysophospholipase L1-like esterase
MLNWRSEKMKVIFPGNIPELHILGRTVRDAGKEKPVVFFWTASGIECRIKAPELWVELESDYSLYEPWVSVRLNGRQIARFMVEKGRRWYCLYRNFPDGSEKTVQLLKDTQAMSDDPEHILLLHAVGTSENAVFLPLPQKNLTIEFAGDSITTGEGLAGAPCEMDWNTPWMATDADYARLTADALNADFRIVSQSGWGIVSGWDNNVRHTIPRYYRQICGLVPGPRYESLGAHDVYDFSAHPADIVIINLGTNDYAAFNQPAWTDKTDGAVYKMHADSGGRPLPGDAQKVAEGVKYFLRVVRECNPRAFIIWCYGMCSIQYLAPYIRQAAEEYSAEAHDSRVGIVELPSMDMETADEHGSHAHPGSVTHRRAADRLIAYIRERKLDQQQ